MADFLLKEPQQTIPTSLARDGVTFDPNFERMARDIMLWILRYRRYRAFGRTYLNQRIGALKKIGRGLAQLFRFPCVNKPKILLLGDRIDAEHAFLVKLAQHYGQKDPRVADLLDALGRSGQYKDTWEKVTSVQGGRSYTSVRGPFILEKLDPLHRQQNAKNAVKFYADFKRWMKTKAQNGTLQSGDTWDHLIAYFLHLYEEDPTEIPDTYHSEQQLAFDQLEFEGMRFTKTIDETDESNSRLGMRGKALTYYARCRVDASTLELRKYDVKRHADRIPDLLPYHTTSVRRGDSQHHYAGNKQAGRKPGANHAELLWSHLYVLKQEEFYVTSPDQFHSYASAGGSVEAAGMIAVDSGKVVAIDNCSGHYSPDWRQVRQGAHKLANLGAFTDTGVVGLYYEFDTEDNEISTAAYLPWFDFLRFCHGIGNPRHAKQTWDQITSRWGNGFHALPAADRYRTVFRSHESIWRNYGLSWEKMGTDLIAYLHKT